MPARDKPPRGSRGRLWAQGVEPPPLGCCSTLLLMVVGVLGMVAFGRAIGYWGFIPGLLVAFVVMRIVRWLERFLALGEKEAARQALLEEQRRMEKPPSQSTKEASEIEQILDELAAVTNGTGGADSNEHREN